MVGFFCHRRSGGRRAPLGVNLCAMAGRLQDLPLLAGGRKLVLVVAVEHDDATLIARQIGR